MWHHKRPLVVAAVIWLLARRPINALLLAWLDFLRAAVVPGSSSITCLALVKTMKTAVIGYGGTTFMPLLPYQVPCVD